MKIMNEKSRIEVRVTGEGFSLETIRPGKVTRYLNSIEAFVMAIVKHDNPELDLARDGALGFTSIHPGSFVAGLISPHVEVGRAWRKASRAIECGDFSNFPSEATREFREFITFNRRHNTEAEFWEYNGTHHRLTVVTSETKVPDPVLVSGRTTLYGKLLRIGGESSPTAQIRFTDASSVTCQVQSTELASSMAERLYETIGVRGTGKWESKSLELQEFRIEELTDYRQTSLTEAFESLREVAGKYYEEIEDVNAFVAELRGRGSEDE